MPDFGNIPINKLTLEDTMPVQDKQVHPAEKAITVAKDMAATKEAQMRHNFTYHAPKPGQQEKYTAIRAKALELALLINEVTPSSREQSLAITHLEESVHWANASIARSQ